MVLLHLPRTHISLSTYLSFTRSPPLFRSQKERQMQRLSPRKQVSTKPKPILGIMKLIPISPDLGSFFGVNESSRAEAVKQI
ncbi:hypothetical protein ACFX13_011898 [Malus domestica]